MRAPTVALALACGAMWSAVLFFAGATLGRYSSSLEVADRGAMDPDLAPAPGEGAAGLCPPMAAGPEPPTAGTVRPGALEACSCPEVVHSWDRVLSEGLVGAEYGPDDVEAKVSDMAAACERQGILVQSDCSSFPCLVFLARAGSDAPSMEDCRSDSPVPPTSLEFLPRVSLHVLPDGQLVSTRTHVIAPIGSSHAVFGDRRVALESVRERVGSMNHDFSAISPPVPSLEDERGL